MFKKKRHYDKHEAKPKVPVGPLGGHGPQLVTGTRVQTGCVNKLFTPSEPRPNTLKSLTHDWDCFLDAIPTFCNLAVIILVKYGVSL